jgi:signal transduction histidine kinase
MGDHRATPAETDSATLRRLLDVVLRLGAERRVEPVLRQVVDAARELTGAGYAAIGVPDGAGGFERFLTAGVDAATWARIGALPRTHGLLGAVLCEPRALRLADIRADPRFLGYPAAHPDMGAFLAVPILAGAEVVAEIFLTNPAGGPEFPDAALRLVEALAGHAALAVVTAQRQERLRELSIVAERTRIARELHDSVTQTLFSLSLAADTAAALAVKLTPSTAASDTLPPSAAASDTLTPSAAASDALTAPSLASSEGLTAPGLASSEGLIGQLDRVRSLAQLGLDELRELVDTLRPAELGRDGLASALRTRVDLLRAVHGTPIALRTRVTRPVDEALGRELLKIANEALGNALRHAGDARASVELEVDAEAARLVVTDDGVGFDLPGTLRASRRLGLTSMRERAEALGGSLRIDTAPGAGTAVTLEVPL